MFILKDKILPKAKEIFIICSTILFTIFFEELKKFDPAVGYFLFFIVSFISWTYGLRPGYISIGFYTLLNILQISFLSNEDNFVFVVITSSIWIVPAAFIVFFTHKLKDLISKYKKYFIEIENERINLSEEIRKREAIESELIESERRYRQIVNNINEVLFQVDENLIIKFVNPFWIKILEFSFEETIDEDLLLFFSPNSRSLVDNKFKMLLSYQKRFMKEDVCLLTKSGQERWFNLFAAPVYDNAKHIIGISGSFQDITQLHSVEEALKFKSDYENLLNIISTTFINASTDEIDNGISKALFLLGQFIEADRSYIILIDDETAKATCTYEWCADNVTSHKNDLQNINMEIFPYFSSNLYKLLTVYIPDSSKLPIEALKEKELLLSLNIPSLILFPITSNNVLIGCLGFDFLDQNTIVSDNNIQLLKITCDIFGNVLVRKRSELELKSLNQDLEYRVQERTAELESAVTNLNHEISERLKVEEDLQTRIYRLQMLKNLYEKLEIATDFKTVYQTLYDILKEHRKISRISLLLYDENLNTLISDSYLGLQRDEFIKSAPQPIGYSISGKCFLSKTPVIVHDCSVTDDIPKKYVTYYNLKSCLALPIMYKNKGVGVLRIDNTQKTNIYTQEDIEFFQMVSVLLGIVIENVNLFTENKKMLDTISNSEKRYKSLFDANPHPVMVFDRNNLNILTVNPAAILLYGYSYDEFLSKKIIDLHSPAEHERLNKRLKSHLNVLERAGEWQHILHDGTIITIEIVSHQIFYDNKEARLVLITDVTQRKQNEEEIRRFIEELQESKDLIEQNAAELATLNAKLSESENQLKEVIANKDKFFSILSHDLKSPFQSILGLSEILYTDIEELTKDEIRLFAGDINKSSKNLIELLNNVLEWSRIQLGRKPHEPKELELNSIVLRVFDVLEPLSMKKQIKLVKDFSNDTTIFADENAISSIIQNLVTNSLKFSFENSEIIVRAKMSRIHNMVHIEVEDHGMGISEDDLQKLFRIDITHSTIGTSNEQGTGLGLVLCKELIEINGGKIWVESTPKVKTIFNFTIPATEKNAKIFSINEHSNN